MDRHGSSRNNIPKVFLAAIAAKKTFGIGKEKTDTAKVSVYVYDAPPQEYFQFLHPLHE